MALPATALHIKGGWIYYEYKGQDNSGRNLYDVTVKVYRDCGIPNPGQNDPSINISIYAQGSASLIGNVSAPQVRIYTLEKTAFSECISPRPQVCYVIMEYRTQIALVPNTSGYVLSFQRCCRINGIVNIQQPSNSLGNTYTISIPGAAAGANAAQNSSPVFVEKDTVVVCFNSDFVLDYSASDPDGDSLVYFFTDALDGAGQMNPNPTTSPAPPYNGLPYNTQYTPQNPFGSNVVINSRTGIITGRSPGTTGEYVLAVGVREYRAGTPIAESRKELHVNVANCNIAAAKLPVRITSCDGFTVDFENLSSSPAILTYNWDFGVAGILSDTSQAAKPNFTYPDTGVYRVKLIINRESACSDSAFTNVAVYPGFFPDFATNGACYLIPFSFSDQTRANFGRVNYWRWDFGIANDNGDTSRSRNPNFTFPQPGNYNVTLEVGSDLGCLDTVVTNIEVLTTPVLNLPFRDTLICSIDSLELKAEGQGTIQWSPSGRMVGANTFNPVVFPLDTTIYRVTLSDRGCVANDSIVVNVLDFITVDAGPDKTICRTDSVVLTPITQALQFQWSPTTRMLNSSQRNPTVYPIDSITTYQVIANLGKCQDSDIVTVTTAPYPVARTFGDTTICFGGTAQLRGQIVGSGFSWSPSTALSSNNQLTTFASPRTTTTYQLTVFDTLGCPKPATAQVVVNVTPRVLVNAGRDTTLVLNQEIQLDATSNVATTFNWQPPIGLSNPNIANPILRFNDGSPGSTNDEIRYRVTATTEAGCRGSDEIVVRLFSTGPSIFVPSAFTPDSDGLNDVIRPILAGMKGLDFFRVYNRYGQLVFETREQGRGWDGTVNGKDQASSAYVYHVQAITFEGTTVQQNGTFVLIR